MHHPSLSLRLSFRWQRASGGGGGGRQRCCFFQSQPPPRIPAAASRCITRLTGSVTTTTTTHPTPSHSRVSLHSNASPPFPYGTLQLKLKLQTSSPLLCGAQRRSYASLSASSANTATSATPSGQAPQLELHSAQREYRAYKKQRRRYRALYLFAALGVGSLLAYHFVPPARQLFIALERSGAVAIAVAGCIYDYKVLFRTEWDDPRQRHLDYKACHSESRVDCREGRWAEPGGLCVSKLQLYTRRPGAKLRLLRRGGPLLTLFHRSPALSHSFYDYRTMCREDIGRPPTKRRYIHQARAASELRPARSGGMVFDDAPVTGESSGMATERKDRKFCGVAVKVGCCTQC